MADNDVSEMSKENLPPYAFKLHLVDTRTSLVKAWDKEISKIPSVDLTDPTQGFKVETHNTTFQDFFTKGVFQCVVSPANSFGLMDGGLDYYISEYYGGFEALVPIVQKEIQDKWCGEQNVGTCLIVDVNELSSSIKKYKHLNAPRYIAHCPTMRTPKSLDQSDDIIYRCTWAMLTAVRYHNAIVKSEGKNSKHQRIDEIVCAGFGTGVGGFSEDRCAAQMALAIKNFTAAPANSNQKVTRTEGIGNGSLSWGSGLLIHWSYARKIERAVQTLFHTDTE